MKKIVWMLVSCLMALSLVMASCGPAEEEEEEVEAGEEEVTVTEEEVEEEVVEEEEGLLPPEVPKYGGVYTTIATFDPGGFDEHYTYHILTNTLHNTHDELIGGDWVKGPAGTGEVTHTASFLGRMELETGFLAESWDMPDDETIIFHIRKGVHWHDKPPVSGRELTAYDVAWSLERSFTMKSTYLCATYPEGSRPLSWTALDKYTVEIKVHPHNQGLMLMVNGDFAFIQPPDLVEQYGNMKDWRNNCGTGPFMLTDYTSATSIIYTRNPNYWQKDPCGPGEGNQLPYLDGLKTLIMPDVSTQDAAMRTGKIDFLSPLDWERAESILSYRPDMEYRVSIGGTEVIYARVDKEELPFKDVRVRQALNLAVNQPELVDDYYKGHAEVFGVPWPNTADFAVYHTPLEEQPEIVQEMFEHHPDKARALLADAGYPDGFKMEVLCGNAPDADFLSIIKGYFADIGVDMEIQMLEAGTFSSVSRGRKHEQAVYWGTRFTGFPWRMLDVTIEAADDVAFYEHPRTRECFNKICAVVGKDDAEVSRLLKEIGPFILEQAVGVWMPIPHTYTLWQPWVQNFYGASSMGYFNVQQYANYIWVDEALKKSMGY